MENPRVVQVPGRPEEYMEHVVVERRGGSPGTQNDIECRWVGEDVIEVEKLIQYRERERNARGV